jgi:hypothetical protein
MPLLQAPVPLASVIVKKEKQASVHLASNFCEVEISRGVTVPVPVGRGETILPVDS